MKVFTIQQFSLVDGRRAEFQSFMKEAVAVISKHFPAGVRHAGTFVNSFGGDHEVEIWTEFPSLAMIETWEETAKQQSKANGELSDVFRKLQSFRNPNQPSGSRLVSQLEDVTYMKPSAG